MRRPTPQLEQNFFPVGFSDPHFEQRIEAPSLNKRLTAFLSPNGRERGNRGLAGGWRSLQRTALRVKFPDLQGKYREFLRFWSSAGRLRGENTLSALWFFSEFPTQRNREF